MEAQWAACARGRGTWRRPKSTSRGRCRPGLVNQHCQHLGINADQMAAILESEQ
jgi:hypothetical protein